MSKSVMLYLDAKQLFYLLQRMITGQRMNDNRNKETNRAKARGSRSAPVIELSASEVIQPEQIVAQTETAASIDTSSESAEPKAETVEPEAPKAAETHSATTDKPRSRSLFLPMSFAALMGGILGAAGGSILPGFLGLGSNAPNQDVQQLKQQIAGLSARSASPEIDGMRLKLQSLETDFAKRLSEAETKLAGRVQNVEGNIKDLAARPAASSATPVDLSPLTQRLGALERDIKNVENKSEAGLKAGDPRIATLTQQLEQATKRMNASNTAPYFAALQGLSYAFQTGQPFATELTAVELLGGKAEDLAALRPLADKGAPTLAQINARFAPLAGKLAQGDTKSESWAASILEKFAKVRPVGQIGGSTPADIVSTIEAELMKGDIATALIAWRKLPEPARNLSADWATAAEARNKAAQSLSQMQEAAIAALRMAKP
jgi:hypothetical protein